jgi:uncharacterized low-complexity protein
MDKTMEHKTMIKPIAAALGMSLAAVVATTPIANAAENPFAMTDLGSGYKVAGGAEGKCGEGKCGGDKAKSDKKKEGKCGEGKCGGDKAKSDKKKEGKCGEGKCGGKE